MQTLKGDTALLMDAIKPALAAAGLRLQVVTLADDPATAVAQVSALTRRGVRGLFLGRVQMAGAA